ncbi:hypothetical protein D8674_018902 [Pyrus ussuriensis x Pyrus communis]|uniref:GBF-interacting protein 1 N-terminal domain-containing protein n=1 Tax=Pyrus ussuriensis x Pyrus communis TaxID=2448454 RepID=A0A5N5GBH1_9ROSA|nr:hypothetical protein D8674_018902 [Pyrus ussuriensis x Pyrus communis]
MGSETKNGVGVAAAQFPPTTRKIIQSLKEIVNCPEPEIYSVLKECNMDPSDAVQRLLYLDTFHEVRSKRERRKEIKETQDTKSRVHNAGSNCGARGISERTGGWCGSTQTSSNELGKAAYKGQSGFVAPSPHTSASHFTGGTTSQQPSSQHESFSTSIRPGDAVSASLQPSAGNQSTYGTSLGNLSMADIVKMGRQPSMGSRISSDTSSHQDAFSTYSCNSHVESSQTKMHQYMHSHNPRVSEMLHKTGDSAGQNDFHDEWRVIEQPTAANRSSALDANQSKFYINESNVPRDYQSHKVQESEGNISSESVSSDCNAYAFASSRQKMADASGGKSYCVDDLSSNSSSYESHRSAYENGEGTGIDSNASYPNHSVSNDVAVASAIVRMQQLNLRKDEGQDNCAVVLPNNLQELAADCSHLSFGTFRPAQSSALSSKPSNSLKNDLGGSSAGVDVFSAAHLDTRNSGYNHVRGSLYDTRRAAIGYYLPVPSQREPIKQDILEATHGYKDITTSSLHNFNSEKIEKATSGLPFAKADPEFRNVPKNDMAYSDSVRSDLLESFQQFLVKPPVPSRYSSAVSSVTNPTISTSDALRPGTIPLSEACSVLPQCHTSRSYAQPTLSYEQLANSMVYKPSMPQAQNYSPVPPNLQQEYVGGSAFHQSGASMEYNFPRYSGASVSRLPTSAAAAVTGHVSFGASNNTHGSLLHNASATPGSIPDYDDVFRPQYKDGNHLATLYQSSRTLPSVPDSAFNNLLGHNQQHAGYRQGRAGQLPTKLQNYRGHPDFYFSQKDVTQEHQRQRLDDLGLGGFQDLSPQQLHQIWQRTY